MNEKQKMIALYLEFDNSMFFWISFFCLLIFSDYLLFRLKQDRDWQLRKALLPFIRRYFIKREDFIIEFCIANIILMTGLMIRSGSILVWRHFFSSSPDLFPYFFLLLGDCIAVAGLACVLRLLAHHRSIRLWLLALAIALMMSGIVTAT